MINQLNSVETNQRSYHEYCETHFQILEERVDDIQGKLGKCSMGQMISGYTTYLMLFPSI